MHYEFLDDVCSAQQLPHWKQNVGKGLQAYFQPAEVMLPRLMLLLASYTVCLLCWLGVIRSVMYHNMHENTGINFYMI